MKAITPLSLTLIVGTTTVVLLSMLSYHPETNANFSEIQKQHSKAQRKQFLKPQNYNTSYSSYSFTSSWAGTICRMKACDTYKGGHRMFNIMSFVPKTSTKCDPSGKVNFSRLPSELQNDLLIHWNALNYDQQDEMQNQWLTYGTCWNPRLSNISLLSPKFADFTKDGMEDYKDPSPYFSTAVEISKIYNLYKVLEDAGVTPSDVQIYSTNDFLKPLQTVFGVQNFGLKCVKDETSGNLMLQSIEMCLDLNYSLISCGASTIIGTRSCDGGFFYPTRLTSKDVEDGKNK